MCGKVSIGHGHCYTKVLSLHSALHYHRIGKPEPDVLHSESSGTRGKYSHWISILQEFDLEFSKDTSKKYLVFAKLMCDLPCATMESEPNDSFPDEFLFLISTTDPWYGDLLIYL